MTAEDTSAWEKCIELLMPNRCYGFVEVRIAAEKQQLAIRVNLYREGFNFGKRILFFGDASSISEFWHYALDDSEDQRQFIEDDEDVLGIHRKQTPAGTEYMLTTFLREISWTSINGHTIIDLARNEQRAADRGTMKNSDWKYGKDALSLLTPGNDFYLAPVSINGDQRTLTISVCWAEPFILYREVHFTDVQVIYNQYHHPDEDHENVFEHGLDLLRSDARTPTRYLLFTSERELVWESPNEPQMVVHNEFPPITRK